MAGQGDSRAGRGGGRGYYGTHQTLDTIQGVQQQQDGRPRPQPTLESHTTLFNVWTQTPDRPYEIFEETQDKDQQQRKSKKVVSGMRLAPALKNEDDKGIPEWVVITILASVTLLVIVGIVGFLIYDAARP